MKENATPSKAFLFSKIIAKTIVNVNCSVGHKNIVYHVLLNFLPGKVKLGRCVKHVQSIFLLKTILFQAIKLCVIVLTKDTWKKMSSGASWCDSSFESM